MGKEMEQENFIIQREAIIKENGKIIKCKDMVFSLILMVALPIKAIGLRTSLTDRENFIIMIQLLLKDFLIIQI